MVQAFIVDLDHTLVDTPPPPALPYDQVDWALVNENNKNCGPIQPILDFVNDLATGGKNPVSVIFMTGRESSESTKSNTESWLKKHLDPRLKYTVLYRTPGDFRIDHEVKKDILVHSVLPFYNVLGALDDKESNCDMFRSFGVKAVCVDKNTLGTKFMFSERLSNPDFGTISN